MENEVKQKDELNEAVEISKRLKAKEDELSARESAIINREQQIGTLIKNTELSGKSYAGSIAESPEDAEKRAIHEGANRIANSIGRKI